MFASKHAVFVGPGELPRELLRLVPSTDGAVPLEAKGHGPRLIGLFETAADAEKVSSGAAHARIGAFVAGPEQPPAEDAWQVSERLDEFGGAWKLTLAGGETRNLRGLDLVAISVLDWKPTGAPADRAVLLRLFEVDKPIYLRARIIDGVAATASPVDGIRRLTHFVDACVLEMPKDTRLRFRRVTDAELRAGELEGDLVPLALAMVDALDTSQAQIGPLVGLKERHRKVPAEYTPLGAFLAWSFWFGALVCFGVGGALMTLGVWEFSPLALGLGVLVAALGSQRIMWSRHVTHATWGTEGKVPSFPLNHEEPGSPPRWPGLFLELSALALCGLAHPQMGTFGTIVVLLPVALFLLLICSGLAVWDESRRRA